MRYIPIWKNKHVIKFLIVNYFFRDVRGKTDLSSLYNSTNSQFDDDDYDDLSTRQLGRSSLPVRSPSTIIYAQIIQLDILTI